MVAALTGVLAHQGGWDEILMVAAPLALFAVVLRVANRRADRQQAERDPAWSNDPDPVADDRGDRSGPVTPG